MEVMFSFLECEEGWEPHKNKCYKKFSSENGFSWLDANFNCNNEGVKSRSCKRSETLLKSLLFWLAGEVIGCL